MLHYDTLVEMLNSTQCQSHKHATSARQFTNLSNYEINDIKFST